MKKYIFLVLSFLLLFSFVVLSKYEDRKIFRDVDYTVTVKIQKRIDGSSHLRLTSLVGNMMEGATFFASPAFTVITTLILTGIAFRKSKWALLIPVMLMLLVAAEIMGKSLVHHPAPPFSMIKHPTTVFPANYINEQFSYPSGHAARAIFLAIATYSLITHHYSLRSKTKRLFLICIFMGYVLLVGMSRIYLGHHWFSDVMGGLFLGSGFGLMASFFVGKWLLDE